jgi:hypothetical protein
MTDSVGNFSSAVSISMGVLLGDVNGNGLVDSGDVFLVRQQTEWRTPFASPTTGSSQNIMDALFYGLSRNAPGGNY